MWAPSSIRHWCHRYIRISHLSFGSYVYSYDGVYTNNATHFEWMLSFSPTTLPLLIRINSVFIWYSDIVHIGGSFSVIQLYVGSSRPFFTSIASVCDTFSFFFLHSCYLLSIFISFTSCTMRPGISSNIYLIFFTWRSIEMNVFE